MTESTRRFAQVVAVAEQRPTAAQLSALPDGCRWLELSFVGDADHELLRHKARGLIRALPAVGQDVETRRHGLIEAARHCDLVVLEPADLVPEVLAGIPAERRLIAARHPATRTDKALTDAELGAGFNHLLDIPARLVRLTAHADRPGDALPVLEWLRRLGRSDVVAYATGPAGFWTRLLAPRFGAPWSFGPLKDRDPSLEVSARRLVEDFALPSLPAGDSVYGIVGGSTLRSLSPRLHLRAYAHLGVDAHYLPFDCPSFDEFWCPLVRDGGFDRLGLTAAGFTVIAPHKEAVVGVAEAGGFGAEVTRQTRGGNLLSRDQGQWRVGSTDAVGVLEPLAKRKVQLRGAPVAVIGCGGAGRAAAHALCRAGASVTLLNRSVDRGRQTAADLGTDFVPLADSGAAARRLGWRVVVSAIPATGASNRPPIDAAELPVDAVVVEYAYGGPTPLALGARRAGLQFVDGMEVLLTQTRRQIEALTGRDLEDYELAQETRS